MPALATAARKSFNGKFTAKIDFLIGHFMLPLLMLTFGSLKSLHTLFDKYLDHMLVKFEQNRMVRTIQNVVLLDKKWLTIFDKVLTPFWKTFLCLKQLFDAKISIQSVQCSDTCNQVKSCTEHGRPDHSPRKLTVAYEGRV